MDYLARRAHGQYATDGCRYDHQDRLTAREAMAHPYFAPIRTMKERGTPPPSLVPPANHPPS